MLMLKSFVDFHQFMNRNIINVISPFNSPKTYRKINIKSDWNESLHNFVEVVYMIMLHTCYNITCYNLRDQTFVSYANIELELLTGQRP